MARGTPLFKKGSIPSGGGTRAAFIAMITGRLTEYQSNGEQAWELAEDLGGAYTDHVYHSVGDRSLGSGSNKGDTDIWIRVRRYGVGDDFDMYAYQDWSPTSSTGYEVNNPSGNQIWPNLSDTVQIDWWTVVNEYGMTLVFNIDPGGTNNWRAIFLGQPIRPISSALNGIARLTSQSGTGDAVVVGLDRDISANITVGQTIWLLNQTPDGQSLQSVSIDLCEVTAVTAGSITLNGVTNTYAVGSLVGWDPAPSGTEDLATAGNDFCQMMDGSSATVAASNNTCMIASGITVADFIPGPEGLYPVAQVGFKMTQIPRGFRGLHETQREVTEGATFNDGDILELEYDPTQRWMVFPSLYKVVSTACLAIGPGAY